MSGIKVLCKGTRDEVCAWLNKHRPDLSDSFGYTADASLIEDEDEGTVALAVYAYKEDAVQQLAAMRIDSPIM